MTVNSTITNTGRVNVLANRGKVTIGSTVHNNGGALGNGNHTLTDDGGFYVAARDRGTGVVVTSSFNMDGTGEVLIRNKTGANGLTYAGNINTTGHQAAIVNRVGDMTISGTVKTTNAPIIISSKGNKMTITNTANLNSGTLGTLYDNATQAPVINQNATISNMEGHGKLLGQDFE